MKRKDDYNIGTIEWACELIDDGEVLVIPNEDCIKAYYNGLTLVSMTDSSFKLFGKNDKNSANNYKEKNKDIKKISSMIDKYIEVINGEKGSLKDAAWKFYTDNKDAIKKIVNTGMPRDKERRSSQNIALQNMSFDNDKYSVCGWEATIPSNDAKIEVEVFDGEKRKIKLKTPEIDLVVVNPSKKEMILVEYKCKGSTMLKGNQNIVNHCKDYMKVKNCDKIGEIRDEMLKAYNLLTCLKKTDSKKIEKEDFDKYTVKVGFLFVDKIKNENNELECEITDSEYSEAIKMLKRDCNEYYDELVYIREKEVKDVTLNNWKSISGLESELKNNSL